MQRDFIEPGGFGEALGNDVRPLGRIVPVVHELLDLFRRLQRPILHTQEGHTPDLSDCPPAKLRRGEASLRIGDPGPMGRVLIEGEPGFAIVPEFAPRPGELVIRKPGKGAFYATGLDETLRGLGLSHLLFAGVTTEVCVQTTMREANDRGYECLLVEDATESYFPELKSAALAMIRAQGGIVGWRDKRDVHEDTDPSGLGLNLTTLTARYAAGATTPSEVVRIVYRRIPEHGSNPIWITLRREEDVFGEALALEARGRDRGPLYGLPLAVKDNLDCAGLPTTAACPAAGCTSIFIATMVFSNTGIYTPTPGTVRITGLICGAPTRGVSTTIGTTGMIRTRTTMGRSWSGGCTAWPARRRSWP